MAHVGEVHRWTTALNVKLLLPPGRAGGPPFGRLEKLFRRSGFSRKNETSPQLALAQRPHSLGRCCMCTPSMASMVPGNRLQCLNGVRRPLDGPSLTPGDPGGMGLARGGHAAAAADPQDWLVAPRDRLNPCSRIGLARHNYRLKLPVRQVQMPESEPATWRRCRR